MFYKEARKIQKQCLGQKGKKNAIYNFLNAINIGIREKSFFLKL